MNRSTTTQLESDYQRSVCLLRHAVNLLDNNVNLITPESFASIVNTIGDITLDMRYQINEVSRVDAPDISISSSDRYESPEISPFVTLRDNSFRDDSIPPVLNITDLVDDEDTREEEENIEYSVVSDNETVEDNIFSIEEEEEDDYYEELRYYKKKPKLKTHFNSIKVANDHDFTCFCCDKDAKLFETMTFDCGHQMCCDCTVSHLRASLTNQPYATVYYCPCCRNGIKDINVNYSFINGTKKTVLEDESLKYLRLYCR